MRVPRCIPKVLPHLWPKAQPAQLSQGLLPCPSVQSVEILFSPRITCYHVAVPQQEAELFCLAGNTSHIPTPRGKDGRHLMSHSQIPFWRKQVQQKVLIEKIRTSSMHSSAPSSTDFLPKGTNSVQRQIHWSSLQANIWRSVPSRGDTARLASSPGNTEHGSGASRGQLHNPCCRCGQLLLPGNLIRCPSH